MLSCCPLFLYSARANIGEQIYINLWPADKSLGDMPNDEKIKIRSDMTDYL